MIVSQTKKLKKNCQKRRNFVTNLSKNRLKWLKFTNFVDNASKCIPYQIFLAIYNYFWLIVKNHEFTLFICRIFLSVGWKKKSKKFFLLEMSWNIKKNKKTKEIQHFFQNFQPTDRKILQINYVISWFLTFRQK